MSPRNTLSDYLRDNKTKLTKLEQEEESIISERHNGFRDASRVLKVRSAIEDLEKQILHHREWLKASGS
jgi:hypothetical protein